MSNANPVSDLLKKRCSACESGTPPVAEERVRATLRELPGWELVGGGGGGGGGGGKEIAKAYTFANYHETIAFVNAVAWVAHREDHHPDLEVGYNRCRVRYSTHSVGGLSENDFICAAKLEALFA